MGADDSDANRETLDDESETVNSTGGGVLDTGLDGVAFSETLLKKAPVLIYVLDPDEHTLEINQELRQVTGYDLTDCPDGDSILEAFYPDPKYRELVRKMHVGWKRNHQVRGLVTNVTTRDGGMRSVSWTTSRVKLDGAPIANVAVGIDVTELTRVKDWVVVQARTLNSVQEGVLLVDNDGQIIRAAGSVGRLLSQESTDIEDKSLDMLVAESSRAAFREQLAQNPTAGLVTNLDLLDGTGTARAMEVRVQPVKIEEETPVVRAILINPTAGTEGSGASATAARYESQIAKLRNESKSKDSRSGSLAKEVQRLEAELESMEREVNALSGRSTRIQSEKDAELDDLKQRLGNELIETRESARKATAENHDQIQSLKDVLDAARKEHANREREIADNAEAKREALRRELVAKASNERKALLEQVMRSNTQVESLRKELDNAGSTDLTQLQDRLQEQGDEDLAALRAEMEAKAEADIAALREENEEDRKLQHWLYEQEMAERTAAIETLEEDVERKIQTALTEQEEHNEQRLASERHTLLGDLAEKTREMERLDEQLKTAAAAEGDRNEGDQEMAAALEASQQESEEKTAELDRKTAELEATRQELEKKASDDLAGLRDELLNQAAQEQASLEEELSRQAADERAALEEDIRKKAESERKDLAEALTAKAAELEAVRRDLEESLAEGESGITMTFDADAEAEKVELAKQLKERRGEIEELRQRMALLEAAKKEAEQAAGEVERRLADEIADLKGAYEAGIDEQRARSTEQALDQARELDAQKEQIDLARAAEAEALAEKEDIERRLTEETSALAERLISEAEAEKDDLSQQIESQRQQLEDLQAELTTHSAAREHAEESAAKVEQRLTEELESARTELSTAAEEQRKESAAQISARNERITELQDQLLEAREAEQAASKLKVDTATKMAAEADAQQQRLTAKAVALQQRLTAEAEDERKALQGQIEVRATRLEALEQQLEAKNGECTYLQQELNQQAAALEDTRKALLEEKTREVEVLKLSCEQRLAQALDQQAAQLAEESEAALSATQDGLETRLEELGKQAAADHEASLDEIRQSATSELTQYRQQTSEERKGLLNKLLAKSSQVEQLHSQLEQMAERAESSARALDEQVAQQSALLETLEQQAAADRQALVAEMEQNKAIELADLRAGLEQQGASLAADVRKSLKEEHEAAIELIQQQHDAAIVVHNRSAEQERVTLSQELVQARKEGARQAREEMQGRVQALLDRLKSQLDKQTRDLEQERTRADDLVRQLREAKIAAEEVDPEAMRREIASKLANASADHTTALSALTGEKDRALGHVQKLQVQIKATEKKGEAAMERLRAQREAELAKLRLTLTELKEENASLRTSKPAAAIAAAPGDDSLRKEVEFLDKQLTVLGLGEAGYAKMARDQANSMAEFSGTAAVVCSANGVILSWSDGAAKLCGVSAEEARGQLLHGKVMTLVGSDWKRLIAQTTMGKTVTEAVTVERADGSHVPALIVAVGMKNDKGVPAGFIEVCRSFEATAAAMPEPAKKPDEKGKAATRAAEEPPPKPSGDAWADVFTGGLPRGTDLTEDTSDEVDLSDAEFEIPVVTSPGKKRLPLGEKVEVDLDVVPEDKEESVTVKAAVAADGSKKVDIDLQAPDPSDEADAKTSETPADEPRKAGTDKSEPTKKKRKRRIKIEKITTTTPDGKTSTRAASDRTATDAKKDDKKDEKPRAAAAKEPQKDQKKKKVSKRAKQQKSRTRNLKGQVKFLQEFLELYPERIEVVRPDPLDHLWERDEPVHFRLKGLECEFETVKGKRIRKSEHLFRVEFGDFFPKKRSEMFLYYDWKDAGGVPFHPNIVSPYNHDNPKQKPGYVCIFAKITTTPTIPWAIQQLAWMLRYDNVNPKQPHAELNLRALEAWKEDELPKSSEPWPFPWGGSGGGSKGKRKS